MQTMTSAERIKDARKRLSIAKRQMDYGFGGKAHATSKYLMAADTLQDELVAELARREREIASLRAMG